MDSKLQASTNSFVVVIKVISAFYIVLIVFESQRSGYILSRVYNNGLTDLAVPWPLTRNAVFM